MSLSIKSLRLPPADIFQSEHIGKDLAKKSIRGGSNALGAQAVIFALNLARIVVLARLLTPEDYGLVGMVMVIVAFANKFKSAGLNLATIQKEKITHDQISGLFWINALLSLVLGLCIVGIAPLVARFYGRFELTAVTAVLAISFFAQGLTVQHAALLKKHIFFSTIALTQIVSASASLAAAIILAWLGWQYWALVAGTLVSATVTLLLTFYFCPWRPGKFKRGSGIRDMLVFGGHITGFEFVNYFARNADNLLIGKFIGADALGIYSKAYQLFLMPVQQIRGPILQVAMPVLSSLRNIPKRYVLYYKNILDILATIIIPIAAYSALEAHLIVSVFLGEQWLAVVPVYRILAICGIVMTVAGTKGAVMMSYGYSKRYFIWGLINSVVVISSFVVGLPYGIVGVAASYTIGRYIILIPSLYYCFHKTPVTVRLFLKTLSPPLMSILAATISFWAVCYFVEEPKVLAYIARGTLFALVYAGLCLSRRSTRSILTLFWKETIGKQYIFKQVS